MSKNKLKTPDWILRGEEKTNEKAKSKTFKIKKCPKCDSEDVGVVVGEEKADMWKCKKCGWKGTGVKQEELTEEEFMKYSDEKGKEVS